jgi:hypothetical protein
MTADLNNWIDKLNSMSTLRHYLDDPEWAITVVDRGYTKSGFEEIIGPKIKRNETDPVIIDRFFNNCIEDLKRVIK